MADVKEEIAREYFENNGFLVRTNLRYYINKNNGGPGGLSDIDLVIANMKPAVNKDLPFILETKDLQNINRASIEVKGWHTERITPKTNNFNRLTHFTRKEAVDAASDFFGTTDFKKILIISSFAVRDSAKMETIKKLQVGGVDHAIEFGTIINSLYEAVGKKESPTSEILQTIRLIKIYREEST